MNFEVMTAFTICAGVYILSRIVGWVEQEKEKKRLESIEEARLEKLAILYGRVKE